jgi:hypothetical protein
VKLVTEAGDNSETKRKGTPLVEAIRDHQLVKPVTD